VRNGRRREFAKFAAFADEAAREAIPDPNAQATFEASRAQPGREAEDWTQLYRTLLALRTREIVPRLAGTKAIGAEVLGEKAVRASWRLGDGATLTIALDLGDTPGSLPAPEGEILFAEGQRFVAWLARA
jgi:maltooligosyltrehalose trehalohydrolase